MAGEQFSVLISREVPISMFGSSSTNLAPSIVPSSIVPSSIVTSSIVQPSVVPSNITSNITPSIVPSLTSNSSLTSNPPAPQSYMPSSYTSLSGTLNNSNGGIRNPAFDDRLPPLATTTAHHNDQQPAILMNNEHEAKIQYATLIRDHNGVGITVAYDESNSICIDSVHKASPADGKIQKNDRLVSINGKDVRKSNMAIEDVEAILNSGVRFVRIVVERN